MNAGVARVVMPPSSAPGGTIAAEPLSPIVVTRIPLVA
jgi:hypothetical protein